MSNTNTNRATTVRYLAVAAVVVTAFFGAYAYASARSGSAARVSADVVPASSTADALTPPCSCCGSSAPTANGITGDESAGSAKVEGATQRISVDLSKGYYDPNVIKLKAGAPAEITFGQSSGCTAQVLSKDLGFFEDLSTGAKTVKLPALEAGEYAFSCGMEMVFGKIVVE